MGKQKTKPNKRAMTITFSGASYDDALSNGVLYCPVCKFPCTYFSRHYTAIGYDKSSAERIRDKADGTGFAGDTEVMEFYCETGHRFSLRFAQHKGGTFISTEYIGVTSWAEDGADEFDVRCLMHDGE